jgi:hypothetical protein
VRRGRPGNEERKCALAGYRTLKGNDK